MIANDLYTIDLTNDDTFLSSSKNLMITAVIYQKAFEKFTSIYHSNLISVNFIEFYINEIQLYDYMFTKEIKDFFDALNHISPNLEIISSVYIKSFFSQCSKMIHKDKGCFLVLNSLHIIDFTEDIINNSDKDTENAVSNIINIAKHINQSDEIIPFYEKYENYMIAKVLKKMEFIDKYKGKSNVIVRIINNNLPKHISSAISQAEKLTSDRIELSKNKGKVTKIVIHKLKLPSEYPKLPSNRYLSDRRASNFISASRQILILNDLQINGVSYSTNFVDKRKAAAES